MIIEVYSAPWCSGCKTVKSLLTSKGVEFYEINIDTELGMTKAKELGIKNIPVTVVNGKTFIGSKPETLQEILKEVVID